MADMAAAAHVALVFLAVVALVPSANAAPLLDGAAMCLTAAPVPGGHSFLSRTGVSTAEPLGTSLDVIALLLSFFPVSCGKLLVVFLFRLEARVLFLPYL